MASDDGQTNNQSTDESGEIERLLREGAEMLTTGQGAAAFDRATAALKLRPQHPLASNLLGLSLLEQGRNDEAREVFDGLVRRHPDVAPLRINSGLAALGQGDLEQALEQFRRAIDLDPTHGRAFGYLALVHLRLGEAGFARAALQEAGLEALAAQIGAEATDAVLQELELGVKALPLSPSAAAPHEGFAEAGAIPAAALSAAAADAAEAAEATEDLNEDLDDALDLALGEPEQQQRHSKPTREIPEVTRKLVIPRGNLPLATPPARTAAPADAGQEAQLVDPALLLQLNTSTTQDGALVREDCLVLQRGSFSARESQRRRKGSGAGPFVVGESRMLRLEGDGGLLLHPGRGRRFHLFRLDEAGLYLRESNVAAFADRMYWENGRIPQAGDEAPPMVNVRGTGFVAALLGGELWSIPTREREPLRVNLAHLLGWSPNAVPVTVEQQGELVLVGFQGAGVVWLDLPGGPAPAARSEG